MFFKRKFFNLICHINYILKGATTIWVIADATTPHGKTLVVNALKYVVRNVLMKIYKS